MSLVSGPSRDGGMKGKGRYKGRRGAGSQQQDGQRGRRRWKWEVGARGKESKLLLILK